MPCGRADGTAESMSSRPRAAACSSGVTVLGESEEGRTVDALAHGGDEGRDKLR